MKKSSSFYFDFFHRLVPGIVHELNNPLSALIMNISILKDDISQDNFLDLQNELSDTLDDMEFALYKIKDYIQAINLCLSPESFSLKKTISVEKLFDYAELLIHKKIKYLININKKIPQEQPFFTYIKPAVVIFSILYAMNQILENRKSDELNLIISQINSDSILLSLKIDTVNINPDKILLDILKYENFTCTFSNSSIDFTFPVPKP